MAQGPRYADLVAASLPSMLEHDRKQAGWSVGQAASRLGVSIREYRERPALAHRASRRGTGSGSSRAGRRRSLEDSARHTARWWPRPMRSPVGFVMTGPSREPGTPGGGLNE
jgi:hypothetical protein